MDTANWAPSASEWRLRARCRGLPPDTFYPPDKERRSARRERELRAKKICLTCPVVEQCRRHALDTQEPHGVWGATTPLERERWANEVHTAAGA